MSHRAHFSLGLGLALSISCFACGDDEDGSKPSTPDSGTSGSGGSSGTNSNTLSGRGAASGNGGSGGGGAGTGSGTTKEGSQCRNTEECASGLACVVAALSPEVGVQICARPCVDDTECGEEVCDGYTDRAQDKHCINAEPKAFAVCGVGETSVCADRTCLYFPDRLVGVCVDLCSTAGPDEDAGTPTEICSAPQSCVPDIVENPAIGVCGEQVERGALCGIEVGKFCPLSDNCVPDNATDPNSESHCREDCSKTGTCSAGTCTNFRMLFSYCKQ
jgi:hypothetical protein